jgi:NO-binding membrane sensor protein with MHYT domain
MIFICGLILIDFGLTYFAISGGFAYEFNKIIAWTFEYSFAISLFIRLAFMAALLIPFYFWARKRDNYRRMKKLAVVVEIVIVLLHLQWIIPAVLQNY